MSIFLFAGIFGYFVSQLVNIIDFKTEITQSSYIRNIFEDQNTFNLTYDNFHIAVKVQSVWFDQEINNNIDRYLKIVMENSHFFWEGNNYRFDKRKINLIPC